jgi:hypothetical protein
LEKVVLELVIEQNLAENGFTERSGEFGALTDVSDKRATRYIYTELTTTLLERNDFVKGATFPQRGRSNNLLKGCRDKFIIKTNMTSIFFMNFSPLNKR